MKRVAFAAALDQRKDRLFLAGRLVSAAGALAADESLVGFHDLPPCTQGTALGRLHGFPDAVAKEPSRLIRHAKHPLELERAHALLGCAHEMHSKQPLGERNLAAFHARADSDRKLVVTGSAVIEAGAMGFALALCDLLLIEVAAMRAARTIGPTDRLKDFAGRVIVGKGGARAPKSGLTLGAAADFASQTGKGVTGSVNGRRVAIGNPALLADLGLDPGGLATRADQLRQEGQTVMLVAVDGAAAGLLAVADPVKGDAAEALAALRARGCGW